MIRKLELVFYFQLCRRRMCTSLIDAVDEKEKVLNDSSVSLNCEDDKVTTKILNARSTYSIKHYEAINTYLDSKPYLKQIKSKIPSHYMLKTYHCHNILYIVNKQVASKFFLF